MNEPIVRSAYKLKTNLERVETVPEPMPAETSYTWQDRLDAWKARWGIERMEHRVLPGLYRIGHPDGDSTVLVTANYRMTFDLVRRELSDRNVWLLVLDTKGVNVWCAAGKGTFGTAELVRRIKLTGLASLVSHRNLVLPQLGATGIASQEVRRLSGFYVRFGPVRASDLPAFLDGSLKATPEMRRVRFTTWDRLVLTPIELTGMLKPSLLAFGILFLLQASGLARFGAFEAVAWLLAALAGTVLTPLLLPWIPGRAFAFKGMLTGLATGIALLALTGFSPGSAALLSGAASPGWAQALSAILLMAAGSSFGAMNFTGCTPYTSPSGVLREMKIAVPLQAIAFVLGCLGLLISGILSKFA